MTELEKLAKQIMTECEKDNEPVTKEEALEMAKMEIGNKQIKRYEKSTAPRKKTTRERKIDTEKAELLDLFIKGFTEKFPRMVQVKNETEFSFTFNENSYTVKLIKHRPPKN